MNPNFFPSFSKIALSAISLIPEYFIPKLSRFFIVSLIPISPKSLLWLLAMLK